MDELPSYWLSLMIAEGDASTSLAGGSILLKLLSVILLVAANGFFVAAEFALVGLRVSRIETLVAAGNRAATAEHASTYTEEELRRLIDISRESGHLRAEEVF